MRNLPRFALSIIAASLIGCGGQDQPIVNPDLGGGDLGGGGDLAKPTCSDGVKNGDETDRDCGGACAACADGAACAKAGDCTSGVCSAAVCAAPACRDG